MINIVFLYKICDTPLFLVTIHFDNLINIRETRILSFTEPPPDCFYKETIVFFSFPQSTRL